MNKKSWYDLMNNFKLGGNYIQTTTSSGTSSNNQFTPNYGSSTGTPTPNTGNGFQPNTGTWTNPYNKLVQPLRINTIFMNPVAKEYKYKNNFTEFIQKYIFDFYDNIRIFNKLRTPKNECKIPLILNSRANIKNEYTIIKNKKTMSNLEKYILNITLSNGGYISGGYANYINNNDNSKNFTDIDVFATTYESFIFLLIEFYRLSRRISNVYSEDIYNIIKYTKNLEEDEINISLEQDNDVTTDEIVNYSSHSVTIKLSEDIIINIIPPLFKDEVTKEDILNDFDFTVNQVLLLDENYSLASIYFETDEQNKELRLNKVDCNFLNLMARRDKLIQKGYTITVKEQIKIFETWNNISEDFRKDTLDKIDKHDEEEYNLIKVSADNKQKIIMNKNDSLEEIKTDVLDQSLLNLLGNNFKLRTAYESDKKSYLYNNKFINSYVNKNNGFKEFLSKIRNIMLLYNTCKEFYIHNNSKNRGLIIETKQFKLFLNNLIYFNKNKSSSSFSDY